MKIINRSKKMLPLLLPQQSKKVQSIDNKLIALLVCGEGGIRTTLIYP